MALKHISESLKDITQILKEHNDKWEKIDGQSNVLPTSDAGTRTTRSCDNGKCSCNQKQSNTTTGE